MVDIDWMRMELRRKQPTVIQKLTRRAWYGFSLNYDLTLKISGIDPGIFDMTSSNEEVPIICKY